jgi:hypothetical protein
MNNPRTPVRALFFLFFLTLSETLLRETLSICSNTIKSLKFATSKNAKLQ